MKTLTAGVLALAISFVSSPALNAADLAVRYSTRLIEGTGTLVKGTIDVTVSNTTKEALRNVDLRLAQPGLNSIEKPLLQFGTIPPGEARIAKASFIFDSAFYSSGAPVPWRVEYDVSGKHHQVVLQGIQVRR
jgi:hypothetical protein